MSTIETWRGKPIADCTREELIECLQFLARELSYACENEDARRRTLFPQAWAPKAKPGSHGHD